MALPTYTEYDFEFQMEIFWNAQIVLIGQLYSPFTYFTQWSLEYLSRPDPSVTKHAFQRTYPLITPTKGDKHATP